MKDHECAIEHPEKTRPLIVSFSGIDGAGKSTQIARLENRLAQAGLSVRIIEFWDDISMFRRVRESLAHAIFKGETGIGSPETPVNRRDKNVEAWYMTILRSFLYLFDAASLNISLAPSRLAPCDVIIFDRYLYDELANLPLNGRAIRAYIRLLVKVVKRPNIVYFLDADPVQAHQRKPEYPLEFVYRNRVSYLALSKLIGDATVIDPMPATAVADRVIEKLLGRVSLEGKRAVPRVCYQDPAP